MSLLQRLRRLILNFSQAQISAGAGSVVDYGLMVLSVEVFHWDLCMVSTASLANIGGSASAPIVASAYDASYAGIGVLMGVLGAAIGNFCGLGMGVLLRLFL